MSGPIVRSGPSPLFTENWDKVFGGKKSSGKAAPAKGKSKSVAKAAAKPSKKAAPKKKKKSSK